MVKWAASLSGKKGRDESKEFIAEGEKLTLEALDAGLPITHILVSAAKKDRILNKLDKFLYDENYKDTSVIMLSEEAFAKISTEIAPQGVISVIKYLDFFRKIDIIYKEEFFIEPSERLIILSSVRDPANVGAVIRSAAAFGVDHIILTADSADLYNPKTVRSAMGSLFRVKATVLSDMEGFIRALRASGRRVYAAELTADAMPLSEIGLSATDTVIIGNEGHGVSPELSSASTGKAYIPISKKTESLNAAVAAAIFMWEQSKI